MFTQRLESVYQSSDFDCNEELFSKDRTSTRLYRLSQ